MQFSGLGNFGSDMGLWASPSVLVVEAAAAAAAAGAGILMSLIRGGDAGDNCLGKTSSSRVLSDLTLSAFLPSLMGGVGDVDLRRAFGFLLRPLAVVEEEQIVDGAVGGGRQATLLGSCGL